MGSASVTNGQPPEPGVGTFRRARDRPWLVGPSEPVDGPQTRRWQRAVDEGHQAAHHYLHAELPEPWGDRLSPGISVVVLAPDHRDRPRNLARCLRSLAGQTLDPARFEIVVVLAGPPGQAAEELADFRRANPSSTIRVIRLSTAGDRAGAAEVAGAARAAGIAAASRRYTTIVAVADYVSAQFLEVLSASATPTVVLVAPVIDAGPAGRPAPPADLAAAPTLGMAKAAPTGLLHELLHDPDLAGQADPVFWLTVLVRGGLRFQPCPASGGAVYHRQSADNPHEDTEPTFGTAVARRLDDALRLEQLTEPADLDTRQLLRDQVGVAADRIGDYLRKQPSDHHRVVAALDHRPIFHFPYHRMNGDRARTLAIAYAFPPYADTSAVVTAKRVRARGELVDVIYNAMDRIRDTDETLQRIAGPFTGNRALLRTPSWFSDWLAMEQFAVAGLDVVEDWVTRKGPYHHVYSRAHFAASHFLAAAYKLRNPAVRWRAEFSDPLSRDVAGQVRGTMVTEGRLLAELTRGLRAAGQPRPDSPNCFAWCEWLGYVLADELVFTNSHQLEYMLGYCPDREVAAMAREKAVISPHPTLPAEFYAMVDHEYPLADGVAHLAYFGNFYATRGLDDVLAALAAADPATRARLRVHVFTTRPSELDRRARELGVSDFVRVGRYVRYLEFLSLTTRFDCLIVNDAATGGSHGRNPYLPSKWADYRGSGAPVWGLVEAGSELSRQPLDYSSPIGQVDAAGEILSLIARREPRSHRRPGAAGDRRSNLDDYGR